MTVDTERVRQLDHDLRTPLMLLTGFADVLASERDLTDAQRRDFAQRIRGAGDELRRLVDELRDELD